MESVVRVMVSTPEEYERGLQAGRQDARLDNHDKQLDGIRDALGSLSDDVRVMAFDFRKLINDLRLGVQELALNAKASADTAVTLAEGVEKERTSAALAIKKEKDDEKTKVDSLWSPWSRVALIATVIAGIVATAYTVTH